MTVFAVLPQQKKTKGAERRSFDSFYYKKLSDLLSISYDMGQIAKFPHFFGLDLALAIGPDGLGLL